MIGSEFRIRLRALRDAQGLSAYALAKRSGVSKQTLSKIESGLQGPSWETVQRLAAALGVDCTTFAEGFKLPPPAPPKKRGRPRKPKKPP